MNVIADGTSVLDIIIMWCHLSSASKNLHMQNANVRMSVELSETLLNLLWP